MAYSLGGEGGATPAELASLGILVPSSSGTPAKGPKSKKTSGTDEKAKADDKPQPKPPKKVSLSVPEDDLDPAQVEGGEEEAPGENVQPEDDREQGRDKDNASTGDELDSVEFQAALEDVRYSLYCKDTENTQKVRNLLLGVSRESRMTRSMIAVSARFNHMSAMEASENKLQVDDESSHWQPLLEEEKAFAKLHPDDEPLYLFTRTS